MHEIGVVRVGQRILNCIESKDREKDWTIDTAEESGLLRVGRAPDVTRIAPDSASGPFDIDRRTSWWWVGDQRATGSCVGWATEAVLRYHFVASNWLAQKRASNHLSVRQIWMASKETDIFTTYPTTFIELAGTSLKAALDIARKYGVVPESMLQFAGPRFTGLQSSFFLQASRLRVPAYIGLGGRNPWGWLNWLKKVGPILTRLTVDRTWRRVGRDGKLDAYLSHTASGGHAVCLVGFKNGRFIVRNSWGTSWGHHGFAYASIPYATAAFTEAYGIVPPPRLPRPIVL